jgi:hypothetical protein
VIQVAQYVRKPFPVGAVRVTASNMDEVAEWCGGSVSQLGDTNIDGHDASEMRIKVPVQRVNYPRQSLAFPGDFVVLSGAASFRVYTAAAFNSSFIASGMPTTVRAQ